MVHICVKFYIKIFIVMRTYFTIMAPVEYLICELYAENRQTLDAKMRQLF